MWFVLVGPGPRWLRSGKAGGDTSAKSYKTRPGEDTMSVTMEELEKFVFRSRKNPFLLVLRPYTKDFIKSALRDIARMYCHRINEIDETTGKTVLHLAVEKKMFWIVPDLLMYGADPLSLTSDLTSTIGILHTMSKVRGANKSLRMCYKEIEQKRVLEYLAHSV